MLEAISKVPNQAARGHMPYVAKLGRLGLITVATPWDAVNLAALHSRQAAQYARFTQSARDGLTVAPTWLATIASQVGHRG